MSESEQGKVAEAQGNPNGRKCRLQTIYCTIGILVGLTVLYTFGKDQIRPAASISIDSPIQMEAVEQRSLVSGTLEGRNRKVFVFVQSMKTMAYYPQGVVRNPDAYWELPVVIGEAGFEIGEQWRVVAVSVNTDDVDVLDPAVLPEDAIYATVTVNRRTR